jgi:hypothetical protein
MKFTIITPTILRPTLVRTCKSIQEGSHQDWQHIVMVDREGEIPTSMLHPNREFYQCSPTHEGWWGALCRHNAFPHIKGDYVLYLDDDDYYVNDCLAVLNELITTEDWGVFTCNLHGHVLLREPPGLCHTASLQFYHKPFVKGFRVMFPVWDHPEKGMDGRLVNVLYNISDDYRIHHTPVLAVAEEIGGQS